MGKLNWLEAEELARWALEYAREGNVPLEEALKACLEAETLARAAGIYVHADMWKREASWVLGEIKKRENLK